MIVAGAWPAHLIKSKIQRVLYKILSFINTWFFMFFMVTMYGEIPVALKEGNILENASLSIIYTMSLFKVYIFKSNKMRKMLYVILDSEIAMRNSSDAGMRSVFHRYVNKRNFISKIFLYLCTSVCTSFVITNYIELVMNWDGDKEFDGHLVKRKLPYVSYFPLDRHNYYAIGFVFHSIIAIQAGFFYLVAQLFVLTFEIHICTRLVYLQHILRNFGTYAKEMRDKYKSEEDALRGTLYLCVVEHQNIISFLTELNNSLKMLMLVDFTTSSFQLASLLVSIIMNDKKALLYFGAVCLTMMVFQVIALYYYANEIKIQSLAIALAAYDSDWFKYSKTLADNLRFIIIRSQKPLALNIGPFGEVSLEKAVALLKTAYSFTAFMYSRDS